MSIRVSCRNKYLTFALLLISIILVAIPIYRFCKAEKSGKNERLYSQVLKQRFFEHALAGEKYLRACNGKPNRLILFLHTWSSDYTQIKTTWPELSNFQDACVIAPNYGGSYAKPGLCGSSESLKAIDQVLSFEMKRLNLSEAELVGASGGGYTALLFLSEFPGRIKKASIWFPIYDLAAWYQESALMKTRYQKDLISCIGHPPNGLRDQDYKRRSPSSVLHKIQAPLEITINVGIYDDGIVPIHHSWDAANHIRRTCPDCTVLYKEFKEGHEFNTEKAMSQLGGPVTEAGVLDRFWLLALNR